MLAGEEVDAMSAVGEVADRMVATMLGTLEAAAITLGARLGCWQAVAAAGAAGVDDAELGVACGIDRRYAREWLESMGAAGLLRVSADGAQGRCFGLADGVREVLVEPGSDAFLLPLVRQASACTTVLRALEAAYRTGGGVGWAEHDPDVRAAQGDANAFGLRRQLPGWVLEHLPEVVARLEDGGRAADVGCGHGWASVGLAQAWPRLAVDAFDVDGPSVDAARSNMTEAAVDDRVSVVQGRLPADGGPAYDLVVLAEMLHDLPDPIGVLTAARSRLAADGVVLVIDMKVEEEYAAPAGDVDRLMYGFSLMVCLPDAMMTRPTAATGTVMRPSTLRAYAAQAGLGDVHELAVEHDTWRFYALRPLASGPDET